MSMGGSGGSSSTQQFTPPSWAAAEWPGYLQQAKDISQRPFQQYGGQTIADLSPEQRAGLDLTVQTAMNSSPDVLAGRGNIQATAQGNYLNNPWTAQDSTLGQTASGGMLQSNPYTSDQYVNQVVENNALNMANANRLGSAAQLDAQFARGGAFGGSAYQQMVAANQGALGKSIGDMASQYRLGAQGLQSQNFQNERGLQQNAALAGLGAYGNERGNMMQASGFAPNLQNMDLQAGQALTGAGDAYRQYTQDLLNQGLQNFNQQQLWPYQQNEFIGNALARSSGNVAGGYSSTMTQPYQASPYASLLGLGALGYGLYGGGAF